MTEQVENNASLSAEQKRKQISVFQAEKESVFLIVRSDERQAVMTALMQSVGMKTRSRGLVLSLPLTGTIGLAD